MSLGPARREEILDRLFAILETVAGLETKARNRGLLDNDARPAAVLLDGDETTRLVGERRGRQRMSPVLLTMNPQIFIVLKNKKPQNKEIGQDLNAFRVQIIRLLANDAELLGLIGTNGDISYSGATTDLKTGMTMEGQMQLNFSITTFLDPYSN